MITEMYMPKNGMDMTEGTIVRWLKNVGDQVQENEPIMEIETDKITMDAEAPGSGVLLKKLYENGATVPVLTVLGYIGETGDAIPEGADAVRDGEAPQTAQAASDDIAERTQLPKSTDSAATPCARQLAEEKGISLGCVAPTGSAGQIVRHDVERAANSTGVARALAAEKNVKLNQLDGSGADGKIRKADVCAAGRPEVSQNPAPAAELPAERRKLTSMRRVIAKRMLESHTDIPTVTQNTYADVTELLSLRKELNEDRDRRISLNDCIIRATAIALTQSERLCMQLSWSEYVLFRQINIGVAVSTADGLLVPVIRDADRKTLTEISAEAKSVAEKARDNKLGKEELGDARITITNLGMYGIHSFTPIINEPECAILGICAAEDYLVLSEQKEVESRKRMMLCLTYDHRILNGTEAAEFSNRVKYLLEHPLTLLS